MYICMYINVYIYICIYMHAYIYTHTYAYIYITYTTLAHVTATHHALLNLDCLQTLLFARQNSSPPLAVCCDFGLAPCYADPVLGWSPPPPQTPHTIKYAQSAGCVCVRVLDRGRREDAMSSYSHVVRERLRVFGHLVYAFGMAGVHRKKIQMCRYCANYVFVGSLTV